MADTIDDARQVPEAAFEKGGEWYMKNSEGHDVPLSLVKPMDLLIDEEVRKIIHHARELSATLSRFRAHTFADIGGLQALIAQDYGVKKGGAKGNVTFHSFDATQRVQVQIADQIVFGPEIQAAKALIDACLSRWSEGSQDELRAIVDQAFNVDKEGQIDRSALFTLMRVDIKDLEWQRAMQAIRDSIRIVGSKSYVRFHERAAFDGEWSAIPVDLARC